MSEMNEYTTELMELVDEHGVKRCFELIDTMELGGEQYFAFIISEEDENFIFDEGGIVILKAVEEDGVEFFDSIEDDDEFNEVYEAFLEHEKFSSTLAEWESMYEDDF